MARAKRGTKARQRRKKVLNLAEGYYGGRHRLFRTAKEAVDRGLVYAYRDRKNNKRNFRQLWQIRIGAAVRELGL
ncbi:MAG: 50S ribosomal protein L20, partial [Deltaproteobacteria bacterium RIFCSPLOWO2_02_FULL_46_8]